MSSFANTGSSRMILLNTDQAAEFLGLRSCTLNDWRWKRIGPPWIRISRGCVRYDRATLETWLDSKTVYEIPKAS